MVGRNERFIVRMGGKMKDQDDSASDNEQREG